MDRGSWLGAEYGRQELRGDWFVGFVQPPEAGEPFGREGSSPGGTD